MRATGARIPRRPSRARMSATMASSDPPGGPKEVDVGPGAAARPGEAIGSAQRQPVPTPGAHEVADSGRLLLELRGVFAHLRLPCRTTLRAEITLRIDCSRLSSRVSCVMLARARLTVNVATPASVGATSAELML